MSWQNIISEKNFALDRVSSLIILMISAMLGMIGIVCPYFSSFFNDDYKSYVSISLLISVELAIVYFWVRYRTVFPKGNKKKQNIVIAITTENNKQKNRITNDFSNNLKKRIIEYRLDKNYDIIIIHSHLSKEVRKRIEGHFLKKSNQDIGFEEKEAFEKMTKRMNARFYIYGDLISRNSPNDRYYLNIDALILHNPVNPKTGETLKSEFNSIWKREIEFLEKEELVGFKTTCNQIFFSSTFMLGLATFVDNQFETGIEIFEKLRHYIVKNSEYNHFENKIKTLLSSSYLLQALKLYHTGNIDESIDFRRKYHSLTPNEYDKCLNEATFNIKKRKDPLTALEFIERAEKISKNDGTWKYNKFYLLIYLEKEKEAISLLDNIIKTNYKFEIGTVNQVLSYNEVCIKEDISHIQSNFITGVFLYKKIQNPVLAYEKLEKFIKDSEEYNKYPILRERAKLLLNEIDEIIGIN
jgi:tetratricopeptide (TPR) repeat protein